MTARAAEPRTLPTTSNRPVTPGNHYRGGCGERRQSYRRILTLRQPTITLTSDTCTSLLPELGREIAEKAAKMIPRSRPAAAEPSAQAAADPQATDTSAHASLTHGPENEAAPEPTEVGPSAA